MTNDDVEDIFKDFEHKVEGKKESEKEPAKVLKKEPVKKLSDEVALKNKYEKAEQALKDKYKKEKESLQEKRKKEVTGHGEMHGRNSLDIEKVAYVAIILVLVVYIGIDLSFYHGGSTEVAEQAVTVAAVQEEEEIIEEIIEEEVVEEVVEEELVLSGAITFEIDTIYTEVVDAGNDLGYLTKIVFTIDNGKAEALTPLVEAFAYDSKIDEGWETKSRGKYIGAVIESGKTGTGSVDLVPKTWRNLDIKKNIRLVLNDTTDGFITGINEQVLIEW